MTTTLLKIAILSLLVTSSEMYNTYAQYTYQYPDSLSDGFNVGTLDEYFPGHKYQWDAPYHHGDLITRDKDMLHNLMSSSKSITSSFIGMAIDQGYIESVHRWQLFVQKAPIQNFGKIYYPGIK